MTKNDQTPTSVEADRLVSDFFEQIVVRDASGNAVSALLSFMEIKSILADSRFPTIPDDLRESLHAVAERASNVDPGFESELRTRYLAPPDAIRHGASKAYEQRLAALSPIDKLKELACRPNYCPTEATLVAKLYLDERQITTRDADYARKLLEIAAEHGNAEAAYLLATAEVSLRLDGDRIGTTFLTRNP